MSTISGENCNNQLMADIYKDNYKNVYYQVLSFVKNRETALDLTQDIFLKVFEHFNTFKGQSLMSTWLYAIAKNHCLEYLRKKALVSSKITEAQYHIASEEYNPEEEMIVEKKNQWIESSLTGKCDPDNQIIYLKHKKNMSVREIQDYMNLSESAVKMRLQRARKRIAAAYFSSVSAA